MSSTTSPASILTQMPRPHAKNAPYFEGDRVHDFLDDFECVAKAAGIANTALPKTVVCYCAEKVHHVIEHDSAFTGQDWQVAKDKLTFFYESEVTKYRVSPEKFTSHVGDMVTKGLITESERDYQFYRGLPSSFRTRIKSDLEKAKGSLLTRQTPTTMAQTITVARRYFREDDIDFGSPSREKEETSEQLSEIQKVLKQLTAVSLSQQAQTNQVPMCAPLSNDLQIGGRYCYLCDGLEGVSLKHRLGFRNCPEFQKLLQENLIQYAPSGKITVKDSVKPANDNVAPQTEKNIRFEFSRSDSSPRIKPAGPIPSITIQQPGEPTWFTIQEKGMDRTVPTPPLINMEDGWFTSSVQDGVSIDNVQDQLLNTSIALTLREVLGMVPKLQKRFSALTRTCKEFGTKATVYEHPDDDADPVDSLDCPIGSSDEDSSIPGTALLTYTGVEDLRTILDRYAGVVALG
ncbi:hypothetical protein BKA93DRAFT_750848 [Sparassis latifolia]